MRSEAIETLEHQPKREREHVMVKVQEGSRGASEVDSLNAVYLERRGRYGTRSLEGSKAQEGRRSFTGEQLCEVSATEPMTKAL